MKHFDCTVKCNVNYLKDKARMSSYIASASHICNVCSSNRQMLGKVHTIRREGDWCILIGNRNKMILDTIHAPKHKGVPLVIYFFIILTCFRRFASEFHACVRDDRSVKIKII